MPSFHALLNQNFNTMMNKVKTSFLYVLLLAIAMVVLSYCSSDSEIKPSGKTISDEITVQSKYLFAFNDKYKEFVESLNVSDKDFMVNYIAIEDSKLSAAKTNVEAKCECGPGQSTCSASGQFSECCICWNPQTHTGACGVYFGIASCKNEPIEPPARIEQSTGKMKFYPTRFSTMLDALEKRGVETASIKAELNTLVSFAE